MVLEDRLLRAQWGGRARKDAADGYKVTIVRSLACGQATAPKEDEQGAQRWWAVRKGVCHGVQESAPWGKTFGEMLPSNIDRIRGEGSATGILRVNVTAKKDYDGPAPRYEAPYAVTGKARFRERVVAPVVFEDRLLRAQWGKGKEGCGGNKGYERGWQAVGGIQGVECTKLGPSKDRQNTKDRQHKSV